VKLPVDTSAIAFLCAVEAEPVVDFETKRPRADENGEPLYMVQLIAMSDGAADIIAVKVPGQPSQAIRQGHPVKVSGLVAQPWTMQDRSGVAFRRPDRAGRRGRQGELTGRRWSPSDREGGDRTRWRGLRSPPPTQPGVGAPGPCIKRWSP